jgi:acyl-CoA dehydrogenase
MMEPGAVRDRLTSGIFVPTADHEPMADLEQALQCVIQCSAIEAKLREAVKQHRITDHGDGQIAQALQLNIITQEEADLLNKLKDLRGRVVKVDDFPPDFGPETWADTGISGAISHVANAAGAGAAGFVAAVSAAAAAAAEMVESISSDEEGGSDGEDEQDKD